MTNKKEGLLLHLSKFPSLISIFPMGETEQAILIAQLGIWKVDHEKLLEAKVSQIQVDRDNALEWVKENLLKESYEERPDDENLDWIAKDMCHAIQVFVNREILPKLLVSPSATSDSAKGEKQ